MRREFFYFVLLGILFLPFLALAGEYKLKDGTVVHFEGLVPCGKREAGSGESPQVTMPCQLCHFVVLFKTLVDFAIFKIAFPVGVLMFVIAGLFLIVGTAIPGGITPDLFSKAKGIMTSVVTGLVIIFAAWIIVNTIFVFMGVADWVLEFSGPGKWFQIDCPIEL